MLHIGGFYGGLGLYNPLPLEGLDVYHLFATKVYNACMFKQIAFFFMGGLALLSVLGGATALQLLPFALFMFLAYEDIKKRHDMKTAIVALSIIMLTLNLAVDSVTDVIAWLIAGICFMLPDDK
jgi:hypothetical protein